MVGVSGRSKGCITCRRRKKGCDQKRPACGQCEARGRKCEGYDSDRMFVHVHQTKEPETTVLCLNTRPRGAENSSLIQIGLEQKSAHFMAFRPTPMHQGRSILVLPDGLNKSAYAERCLENFFDMYNIPTGDSHSYINGFASTVSMLYVREQALRLALLANGTAALSLRSGDQDMIRQARKLYGQSLQEMGQAIVHPRRGRSEALLAVPRALGLFEILFGADAESVTPARGWYTHTVGETALIEAQGPLALAKGMGHQLFVDGRLNMIFGAIRKRKRTFLEEEEWKTKPWNGHVKTPRDYLLDILAGTPGLLEDTDKLAVQSGSKSGKMRAGTIARCWTLHGDLDAWLEDHGDQVLCPENDSLIPVTFPSAEVASLSILYWTTCLVLYQSFDDAIGISPTASSISYPDRPHARKFARLLARSTPYLFRESLGLSGAAQLSFSLGIAMMYMRRNSCDMAHRALIMQGWMDPMLPSAIRDFLLSMKLEMKDVWYEASAEFDSGEVMRRLTHEQAAFLSEV